MGETVFHIWRGRALRMAFGITIYRLLFILSLIFLISFFHVPKAAAELNQDIDLVRDKGLYLYSQKDYRYAYVPIGPNEDVYMGRCGCFLASLSTGVEFLMEGSKPWNIVKYNHAILGEMVLYGFNPIYLHKWLKDSNGYISQDSFGCGVTPKPWALELLAEPWRLGNTILTPTGIQIVPENGFGSGVKEKVDAQLILGRPSIIGYNLIDANGKLILENGKPLRHTEIIVGWDNNFKGYRIVDPSWESGSRASLPTGEDRKQYNLWQSQITTVFFIQPVLGSSNWLTAEDDPEPIELMSINPDGLRTGFDPVIKNNINEDIQPHIIRWGDGRIHLERSRQERYLNLFQQEIRSKARTDFRSMEQGMDHSIYHFPMFQEVWKQSLGRLAV